jgi:hypothetical protein
MLIRCRNRTVSEQIVLLCGWAWGLSQTEQQKTNSAATSGTLEWFEK